MSIYLRLCNNHLLLKTKPQHGDQDPGVKCVRVSLTVPALTQAILIGIQLEFKLSDLLLQRYSSRSGLACPFLFPCCFRASLCTETKERERGKGRHCSPSFYQGNTDEG